MVPENTRIFQYRPCSGFIAHTQLFLRGGSSPKILGHCPHLWLPLHNRVHFFVLRNRKKYELHIGIHLKSVISIVASSVGPRAGVEFLAWGSEPPPHQRGNLDFGFWSILGPQKSRQNGQLAFDSGQQVNLGGKCPPAPT